MSTCWWCYRKSLGPTKVRRLHLWVQRHQISWQAIRQLRYFNQELNGRPTNIAIPGAVQLAGLKTSQLKDEICTAIKNNDI